MRLSEWRAAAPKREAAGAKVKAMVDPLLAGLGSGRDPHCWVAWGDEPAVRYSIFVPTPAGLIVCNVRVAGPGGGPRAAAKLVRWNRVQVGELAFESQAGRRLAIFQLEQQVINASDKLSDQLVRFALILFAAMDGRRLTEKADGS
jgi:hypothetical protein